MNSDFKNPINLGNSYEISILNLAKLIDKKIFSNKQFYFDKSTFYEPKRRCPSLRLVEDVLKWKPKVNLNDGLDLTIESFKN